jgi:hypothetical protein
VPVGPLMSLKFPPHRRGRWRALQPDTSWSTSQLPVPFGIKIKSALLKTRYQSLLLISFTDKQENKIFLIYKEIQKGSVAKSYMTNGLVLIYG